MPSTPALRLSYSFHIEVSRTMVVVVVAAVVLGALLILFARVAGPSLTAGNMALVAPAGATTASESVDFKPQIGFRPPTAD